MFNKTLLDDLKLENPYELVYNDEWTLDKMSEIAGKARNDLDGNGIWDVNDRYPFGMFDGNTAISFLCMGGFNLVERDADNLPVWNGLSEKNSNIYDKVLASTFYNDTYNNSERAPGTLNTALSSLGKPLGMFESSRSLFFMGPMDNLRYYNDVQFEVGVVPFPKVDDQQENYETHIFGGAEAIAIPAANPNPEFAGVVLEYMAAYTQRDIRHLYFDLRLDFKYVDDDNARDMLDIILSTGSFDIFTIYNWGEGLAYKIMNNMIAGETNLASLIDQYADKIPTTIQNTIDKFVNIEKE